MKRRNVFRVGIAYLIGGWLVIQVADTVLDNIGAPAWVMQTIFLVLVLGLVVALFFAWAFEVTPEGLKRESEIDRSQSITGVTGYKLNRSIVVLLVIALAYFVWESRISDRVLATAVVPASPSVAVLAFKNMSPDPENAYFAEGISEEILNVLASIDGLRVASRTSAFSFADTDTPIPEIASQLNVAHILEGSVRKQGTRVRITAQLIDAATDTHLWSDTYNRDLDDIFAVQEEIAIAISGALMGVLGMEQITVLAPTKDMAAYELFLRGRQQFYARGPGPLEKSIADLEAAVARDPEFAEAWSYLSASLATYPGYMALMDAVVATDLERRSEEAASRALALDPNQALAVAVQGQNMGATNSLKQLTLLERAAEMAPADAGILMWAGDAQYMAGIYSDEAVVLLERAYRLDPLSGINNGVLGIAYLAAGQRDLGRQHIRRAAELDWNYGTIALVLDLLWTGDTDGAVKAGRSAWPDDESVWTDELKYAWEIMQRIIRREIASNELVEIFASGNFYEANLTWQVSYYNILGDYDRMFDAWLAMPQHYQYLVRHVFIPSGQAVMEHPRMLELAEKLLLLQLWESEGYPFGCERVQDEIGDHLICHKWPQ